MCLAKRSIWNIRFPLISVKRIPELSNPGKASGMVTQELHPMALSEDFLALHASVHEPRRF